jgi:hypothetical protein
MPRDGGDESMPRLFPALRAVAGIDHAEVAIDEKTHHSA